MSAGARWNDRPVDGGFVARDDGSWYRIRNVDRLPPFLTTVASASDHWLYASSRGPLTAGRRNVKSALFPYCTEDKLHDAVDRVGGRTIVHVEGDDRPPWEPFSERGAGVRDVSRDLSKHVTGTALAMEECEHELGLRFRATWSTSERFGIVRTVELRNLGDRPRTLRVVDGLLNLLPSGVDPAMQAGFSSLVDAYKTARLHGASRIGVFALSSIPVDRAEPSESLRATTVWCTGADDAVRMLSDRLLEDVRRDLQTRDERSTRGQRCAYLIDRRIALGAGESATWTFACEVDQDAAAVTALERWLGEQPDPAAAVRADVASGRERLLELMRSADGVHCTDDPHEDARHFSNVLFNSMRGGLFPLGHDQDRDDFVDYLAGVAPKVLERHRARLADWPRRARIEARRAAVEAMGDADLERLHREYLPLALSRRHGDPSRPWNTFSIETRRADGSLRCWYEGNWRDIFQNWEALAVSFPAYAEAFVARFVNASTADGYNPYRITRAGIDWEVHDPDDPWSFIGYWGDHQIVYLTRLLERCRDLVPGRIEALLDRRVFVYADVPYRIRSHAELVADPHRTVDFDDQRARAVADRVERSGVEGKLVPDRGGEPLRVTLAEKLLVPFLVKLTNLVPGAGIWMNTQRPEWNDANNALVGRGASVVTVCALWRHATVLAELIRDADTLVIREPVARLCRDVRSALSRHDLQEATTDATSRRAFFDDLGRIGEAHREAVYAGSFGDESSMPRADVLALLDGAKSWLAATIESNRRDDGLYHSYNLISLLHADRVELRRLDPMLEGQVAVLASGLLDPYGSRTLLDALHQSALRCPERQTFLLYPDRELPSFLEKNRLPADAADRYPSAMTLVLELIAKGHRGVALADVDGTLRFCADLRNARDLERALDALGETAFAPRAIAARSELLALYEEVFDHAAFTGRSGTFFGYEGLGCVYWHMAAKLALAVQESLWRAHDAGAPRDVLDALLAHCREVRAGLGIHASPAEWGAFPTDAYSHTPSSGGARQPGMTGQVKEDILRRLGELGVRVRDGRVGFDPLLLQASPRDPSTIDLFARPDAPTVSPHDAIRFTLCGSSIRLERGEADALEIDRADGRRVSIAGRTLDAETSTALLLRTGEIRAIRVRLAGK